MGTPQSGPFSSWTRQGDVWGDLGAGKEERGVWFRLSNVPWSQAQSIHDIPKKEEDLENFGIWETFGDLWCKGTGILLGHPSSERA